MIYPDNNPKTVSGMTKVPLHLVPPSAKHFLAAALADGAKKYGPYNWRNSSISISVYKSACERHLDAFWDGESLAEDSQVHHLAHAMACLALMLDAMTVGRLHDDRPEKGNASALQYEYAAKQSNSAIKVDQTLVDPRPTFDCGAGAVAYAEYIRVLVAWRKRNPDYDNT